MKYQVSHKIMTNYTRFEPRKGSMLRIRIKKRIGLKLDENKDKV